MGSDPLIGRIVQLPDAKAEVLSIEHEYDDGTTLRYVDGDYVGSLTMRDTFSIRNYPIVD